MRATLLVLLALTIHGCAFSLLKEPPPPLCTKNTDCASGQTCYADGCDVAVDYAVRVTPNSPDYPIQDFNPVSAPMSKIDLTLQDPGILEGTLKVRSSGNVVPYTEGFTLTASGHSSIIPGLAFNQSVSLTVPSGTSLFSVAVAPGIWDLAVMPSSPPPDPTTHETPVGPLIPPLIPPVFLEKAVGSGDVIEPGLVLGSDSLNEIQGRLVVSAGEPWPKDNSILFHFQAFDAVSQTPVSQVAAFLSTSTFHVYTTSKNVPLFLRVSPDLLQNKGTPIPSKDFPTDVHGAFVAPFEMGAWGDPVTVAGVAQNPTGGAVANATVRAEGQVRGGGTFAVTALTDEGGRFSLQLLPSDAGAKYTFTVHPPLDSVFATSVLSQVVDAAAQLPAIVCQAKVALSGRVLGPLSDGTTGPLASVPLYIEGNPASAEAGPSAVRNIVTDSDGAWKAAVEPGSYRVVATPPADLPWGAVVVTATTKMDVPDIVLTNGRLVTGSLIYHRKDGTDAPITGATVTVFRPPTSNVQPMKVYEALTDSSGLFRLVVPKAPEASGL